MSISYLDIDYITLGREIRRRRNKLGLTQLQLADMLSCSPSYISHLENGNKPSLPILIRLAHLLELSLDTLL